MVRNPPRSPKRNKRTRIPQGHLDKSRPNFHRARPTPPDTYPPIHAQQGHVSAVATGVAGLVGGALLGAGWMASKKLDRGEGEHRQAPDRKES